MITIFAKATNQSSLRDLLRSLINNADNRKNYQIFVGGDPKQDDKREEILSEFREQADVFLMKEGEDPKAIETELFWCLSDEVFVLGHHWDKRILFHKDKYPDDIIVMFPSGIRSYAKKSESEIALAAERNPVVSAQWVELAGLHDVEMVCRSLALNHGIDRRVDISPVKVQFRGKQSLPPEYNQTEVEKKSQAVSQFILNARSE